MASDVSETTMSYDRLTIPPAVTANPTLPDAVSERGNTSSTGLFVPIPILRSLLEPFVGAKLVRQGGFAEGESDNHPAVDISYHGCTAMDADIRVVDDDGIERFFYSGTERIAWADVRRITIRRAGPLSGVYFPIFSIPVVDVEHRHCQRKHCAAGDAMKADRAAIAALGSVYEAVPKSAFALIAYHLARLCAGEDEHDGALARLIEEADALAANGIMPERHAKALRVAIAKARGQ